ncbi:MAG: YvcK family protein [Magnetococcales bacterium]|nr:YvcK family protein [Magnetococcales bacterium]
MTSRLRIALFSGGRGTQAISRAFLNHGQVELTILVNAYDDGLSTGFMRRYIPGLLGPSDIRKNVSHVSPETAPHHRALTGLLEFRFPPGTGREAGLANLRALMTGEAPPHPDLAACLDAIAVAQLRDIRASLGAFLEYEERQHQAGQAFEYGDCSLGNILFAGQYLICARDFNATVAAFNRFAQTRARVLNITDGRNLVLSALTPDGELLADEAAIVSSSGDRAIQEIFLLPACLDPEQRRSLERLSPGERLDRLRAMEAFPEPNPEALAALREADLIIFGPGTQNSSLFPSYLTRGVRETLLENRRAETVFVANISQDHDIFHQSVQALTERLCFYMGRKTTRVELRSMANRVFVQAPDLENINRPRPDRPLEFDKAAIGLDPDHIVAMDWEDAQSGRHQAGFLVDELLALVGQLEGGRLNPFRHMVSIVVPVLDEAATLRRVLRDLWRLDFSPFHVGKEIILVDGGSTDGSLELARQEKHARVFAIRPGLGRGAAIRHGIGKARGDIIALFPADGEYEAEDLLQVVAPIVENRYQAVFGSRLTKCITTTQIDQFLRQAYGNDRLRARISRYGGWLTSLISLLLYNRYLSDPFSTLKAFDGVLLRSLPLGASGMHLESEIIAALSRNDVFVLEVPVRFRPRTRAQGKKIRIMDGIRVLAGLFYYRFHSRPLFSRTP